MKKGGWETEGEKKQAFAPTTHICLDGGSAVRYGSENDYPKQKRFG
jgi:hypothetical protein